MIKIALIDKCPGNTNYLRHIEFLNDGSKYEVHTLHLTEHVSKKVLKRDVTLELDKDEFDYIFLIGSEASSYFTHVTSVMSHAGQLVDEKFIPMINPAMLAFKPDAKKAFDMAVNKSEKFITGTWDAPTEGDYIGIRTEAEAYKYLKRVRDDTSIKVIALDSETTSLHPREGHILGISMSHRVNQGVYIESEVVTDQITELMQEIIDSKTVVMHNAKFDIKFLHYHLRLDFPPTVDDTMLLHYLLDETAGTHGLKHLAIKYTKLGEYDRDLTIFRENYCKAHKIKKADFTYDLIPFEIMYKYAAMDTAATIELYLKFKPLVDRSPELSNVYYKILRPGMRFLNDIEENGVPFSKSRLEAAKILMDSQLASLKEQLYSYKEVHAYEETTGTILNANSPVQLRNFLFTYLGLKSPGKRTATGALSTDAEVLQELGTRHPVPSMILGIKQTGKIKSTYIEKILPALDRDSRLRTGFNLTTTTSGRLSSSGKLNMQQLPRDNKVVKACIKAQPGYTIISQDLKTAEMYYAAVLSGDKKLQSIFKSTTGDFHSSIAHMVFNLPCEVSEVKALYPGVRQAAKAVSFGIMYGSGAAKVAASVTEFNMQRHLSEDVPFVEFTESEAKDAIATYFATYSRLAKWLAESKAQIKKNGFIFSAFGRKRRLLQVFSSDKGLAASDVRSGVNFLIQSVASDINLLAAMDIHNIIKDKKLDAKVFALVHDSILAEVKTELVPEFIEMMKEVTQRDRGFSIPNSPIGVDAEWGEDYSFYEKEALYKKFPEFEHADTQ